MCYRLPVCPSITQVDHTKTVEVRIMKFSPYGSLIPLVFAGKFHPEILRGPPERRRQTKEGWVNQQFSIFKREYRQNVSRYG